MAGNNSYLNLEGRQRKYIGTDGSPFKGFQSVSTPLPPGTDLGQGYIPPSGGPSTNPNTSNPYIDPATGKPYPRGSG